MATDIKGRLTLDKTQFETGLQKVSGSVQKFQRTMDLVSKAIAATFVTGAIGRAIKGVADFGDQLSKTSQRIGITVEALNGLQFAAGQAGANAQKLNVGLRQLSKNMFDFTQDTGEAKIAFQALGIEVLNTQGKLKGTDTVLLDLADRFSQLEDGTAKSALAQKLFGESGTDLIPLLNQGADGVSRLVAEGNRLRPITEENAEQAAAFNDALSRLTTSSQGFLQKAILPMLPQLANLAESLARIAGPIGDALAFTLAKLTQLFETLAAPIKAVVAVLTFGFEAAAQAIEGNFGTAFQVLKDLKEELKDIGSQGVTSLGKLVSASAETSGAIQTRSQAVRQASGGGGTVPLTGIGPQKKGGFGQAELAKELIAVEKLDQAIAARKLDDQKRSQEIIGRSIVETGRLDFELAQQRIAVEQAHQEDLGQRAVELAKLELEITQRKARLAGEAQEALGRQFVETGRLDFELSERKARLESAQQQAIGQQILERLRLEFEIAQRTLAEKEAREETLGRQAVESARLEFEIAQRQLAEEEARQEALGQQQLETLRLNFQIQQRNDAAREEAQERIGRATVSSLALNFQIQQRQLAAMAAAEEALGQQTVERLKLNFEIQQRQLAEEAARQEALGQQAVESGKLEFEISQRNDEARGEAEERLGQQIVDRLKLERAIRLETVRQERQALRDRETRTAAALEASRITGGTAVEQARIEMTLLQQEFQRISTAEIIGPEQEARLTVLAAKMQELNKVSEGLHPIWAELGNTVKRSIGQMVTGVLRGTQTITEVFNRMLENIAAAFVERGISLLIDDLLAAGKDQGEGLIGAVSNIFNAAGSAGADKAEGIVTTMAEGFGDVMGSVESGLDGVVGFLGNSLTSLVSVVGSGLSSLVAALGVSTTASSSGSLLSGLGGLGGLFGGSGGAPASGVQGPPTASGGFFSGGGGFLSDLFSFGQGGVMTNRGPLRLQAFASGGVSRRPTLALFGEGRQNEAFVPLPDGRRIPVTLNGQAGGNTTVTVINNTGETAQEERRQTGRGQEEIFITIGQRLGEQVQRRGPLGLSIEKAFGLNLQPGSR